MTSLLPRAVDVDVSLFDSNLEFDAGEADGVWDDVDDIDDRVNLELAVREVGVE